MAQKLSASRISPKPVTMDDLNSGLQKKQNKLIAGTGIQIEDDTISSTVNSAKWGNITGDITQQTDLIEKLAESGGSGKTDNITITKNEADELQAEGCLNQLNNTTPIKFWSGTKAEYDAIKIKDDDTLYNVDEDSSTIHSGDDEVITGIKTFDGQEKRQSITITNDLVDINTESETPSYSSIYFTDKKTSKVIGDVASATTKYNTGMLMACENPYNLTPSETIKQESLYPQIGVYSYPDGTYSSVAPEPVESSNDQNIATTSFVNKTVDKKVGNEINSNLLNYTTNRILEIPQDIVITFDNGVLTLISGSKLYVPNGFKSDGTTPKFDIFILQKDVISTRNVSVKEFYLYETKNDVISQWGDSDFGAISSGTTAPTGKTYMCWYDLNENKIKVTKDSGATWEDRGMSFPFCLATSGDTAIKQVDQLFNGFGYIGSTAFALPGVKYQFADGRNEDRTYKSITKSFDNVSLVSYAYQIKDPDRQPLSINDQGILIRTGKYFIQNNQPVSTDSVWYKPKTNEIFRSNGSGVYDKSREIIIVNDISTNSEFNITSFEPSEVQTINSYQRTELAGMSMPSNKYINLTLGATGTTYIAPDNGWVYICLDGPNSHYVQISCDNIPEYTNHNGVTSYVSLLVPVTEGTTFSVQYVGLSKVVCFRFIYAQGSQ